MSTSGGLWESFHFAKGTCGTDRDITGICSRLFGTDHTWCGECSISIRLVKILARMHQALNRVHTYMTEAVMPTKKLCLGSSEIDVLLVSDGTIYVRTGSKRSNVDGGS